MERSIRAAPPGSFVNPDVAFSPGEGHGDPFVVRYLDSYFRYHAGDSAGRRGPPGGEVRLMRIDRLEWTDAGPSCDGPGTERPAPA